MKTKNNYTRINEKGFPHNFSNLAARKPVNEKKRLIKITFTEIFLLVLGIFAVSYILGSVDLVKAQEDATKKISLPEVLVVGKFIDTAVKLPVKSIADVFKPALTATGGAEKVVLNKASDIGARDAASGGLVQNALSGIFGKGVASGIVTILESAAYAAATYVAVKWVAEKFGAQPGQAKALASGAAAGVATGYFLTSEFGSAILTALGVPGIGWIVAGITAILVTVLTWKDEKQVDIAFMCGVWQPQPGGKFCEKCNEGPFPCSEYQCSSLGVSCQIINKGTKEQKCVWVDRNDVDPPIMTPWEEALKEGYSYSPNNAVSPPNRGVFVKYSGTSSGCAPPYTLFSFGVKVNKESKCRADITRTGNFSNFSRMRIPLSGDLYSKEHEIILGWPNMRDLEAENITLVGASGKDHKLYVKCMSGNGVVTNAHLEFSYCIDDSPDLNPPRVVETNVVNGSPLRFGIGSLNNFVLSIDKPGECRWSTLDRVYEDMENNMTCSTNVRQTNARTLYDCRTDLTGIKDREANDFYFRCKGSYNNKTSKESYKFTVFGTQPLVVSEVGPNTTIKDSTDPVKVTLTAKTAAGFENGKAICQFSRISGSQENYLTFFNTNSHVHSQELRLSAGTYNYSVRCVDSGGNSDMKVANFTIEIDKQAPAVVRAFHEDNYLKIITNEPAECVYDNVECLYEFEDGEKMTTLDDKEHYTNWNTQLNFYIKCRDQYGNQPAPDKCSIIARPFTL